MDDDFHKNTKLSETFFNNKNKTSSYILYWLKLELYHLS